LPQIIFAQNFNPRTNIAGGVFFGYNNGVGFGGNVLLKNLAEGFPFNIKLGVGFSFLNPGKPDAVREMFINDATDGVPEKAGRLVDLRADFLYNFSGRNHLYAGPRFALFTGNFNYVGGNEDFDITSNQWGLGVGAESYFRISPVIDLVFSVGYDYFFSSAFYGHDTFYSPDGEIVNGRKDFTYEDADDAVNQPKHNLKATVGLSYNF
jgi:hypothetical protein